MRRPIRILHTSDLHFHRTYPTEAFETIRALARFAEAAAAEAVIVAGDLFDSANQPAELIEAVAAEFRGLPLPLVAIPGNHDIRYSESDGDAFGGLAALAADGHIYIDEPGGRAVDLLDGAVRVWGRGMPEHTPANDPLAHLPGARDHGRWSIVLAHGELNPPEGTRSSPIVLERHAEALAGVDYLALGHRHAPETARFGAMTLAYSGSGSSSPVVGPGSVALVDLRSDGSVVVTHEQLHFERATVEQLTSR